MPTDATEPTAPRWLDPGEVPSVPGLYEWHVNASRRWASVCMIRVDETGVITFDVVNDITRGQRPHVERPDSLFFGPIPEPDEDA